MIAVGPPGGPLVKIPAAYTITVAGEPPYDLRLDVAWDPSLGRHTLHELTITEQPDGVYVRMSRISQIALAELIERSLVADVLGGPEGWPQLVAEHAEDDPGGRRRPRLPAVPRSRRAEPFGDDRHCPRPLSGEWSETSRQRSPGGAHPAGGRAG